jgi:hypothetical protein
MDFRPGDGMSCVAVAIPHAALWEGTTGDCARAAPDPRRGGRHDGAVGLQGGGLSRSSRVDVCEAERRGTNQKGMRGAKTVGEDRERLRLC